MALAVVRNWFGRQALLKAPVAARAPRFVSRIEPVVPPTPPPRPVWTPERLATTDALWGDGYQFPGGEIETLRLAKPLGLSVASSLLLLGGGGGGPACSVNTKLGAWVTGFEADPSLVAAAAERIARGNLSKRVQMETWNPEEPVFRKNFYHHGLALEPLNGAPPEPVLAGIASALKPGGQLMITELIADQPLNPADPAVAAWAALERRDPRSLPTESTITRTLGRLRFDVRVVEDLSQRHMQQAMAGWRAAVRLMEEDRPTAAQAMRYVREAELWLLRLRLIQMGRLRLVRWHAIVGGS